MQSAEDVVRYWAEAGTAAWYRRDDAFDADIRARFTATYEAARDGALEPWGDDAQGSLALLILLDQFPRNMFRDDPRAFATDAQALAVARRAIDKGFDLATAEPMRQFFYLPFMHAEDDAAQNDCIAFFETRMPETGAGNLLHARAHAQVIARFGRFPHRNADLGRDSSPEEIDFLASGGYGAVVRALGG